MYDTFELLRRMAQDSREAVRQLHGGIDPVTWEALLDRVEDQLEMDDREDDAVSESVDFSSLRSCTCVALPLSIFASGALGADVMQSAVGAASGGNQFTRCVAAGAAWAGLGLTALRDRNGYQTQLKKEGVISVTGQSV